MNLRGANLIGAMWIAWAVVLVHRGTQREAGSAPGIGASRAGHIVPLVHRGVAAVDADIAAAFLGERFLPATPATFYIGAVVPRSALPSRSGRAACSAATGAAS